MVVVFFSKLGCTAKTHKPAGEVCLRAVHESHAHPFEPGKRYVASHLREKLQHLPHLIRDTAQLIQLIRKSPISSSSIFLKLDIKDYYMMGDPAWLARNSCAHIDDSTTQTHCKALTKVILENQYVKTGWSEEVWQVKKGSGQGL